MQANEQNMLIDQQENGEMPQNLNQQQLRQVEGMQGYPQEMQDMYDEEYEDDGEEMVGDEDIDGEMDAYGEEHMMAEEGVNRHWGSWAAKLLTQIYQSSKSRINSSF